MDRLRQLLKDNRGFKVVTVISVSLLLIGAMVFSFSLASADEHQDELGEVEAPEWKEGYSWTYKMREPVWEDMTWISEIEREVVNTNSRFSIDVVDSDRGDSFDTYQIDERWVVDEEGEDRDHIQTENHFTKDKLSRTFTNPVDGWASFYYPPIIELNFDPTLSVGDYWIEDEGWFFETPDVETEDELEPIREIVEYAGEVEGQETKAVEVGGTRREFETLMINFTIFARDLDPDEEHAELRREEIYYAPEVKNVIHREMYQTMRVPDDYDGPGDEDQVKESWVGNETLIDYSLEADGDGPQESESMLGVWVVLAIVGVGVASIVVYKKTKSSF